MSAVPGRRPSLGAEQDKHRPYGFALLKSRLHCGHVRRDAAVADVHALQRAPALLGVDDDDIFATYAGGVLVTLVAFGSWSDAVGRRPMLLVGVVAALASAVVSHRRSGATAAGRPGAVRVVGGHLLRHRYCGRDRSRAAVLACQSGRRGYRGECRRSRPRLTAGRSAGAVRARSAEAGIRRAHRAGGAGPRRGAHGVGDFAACWYVHRRSVPSAPPYVRPVFGTAATAVFAGFAVMGLFGAVAPSFVAVVIGIPQPCGRRGHLQPAVSHVRRRADPVRADPAAAGDGARLRGHGHWNGDSGCGHACFVVADAGRGSRDRRRWPGYQLLEWPGRRDRPHARRSPCRGQLRLFRGCLPGAFATGGLRRPRRPGMGPTQRERSPSRSRSRCWRLFAWWRSWCKRPAPAGVRRFAAATSKITWPRS